MAAYNFPKSFFFPTEEDGNFSLHSVQQRIEQAVFNLASPEDYIELDDGSKCFTKEELERALFTSQATEQKKSSPLKKMEVNKIILLATSICFTILSFVYFFTNSCKIWMFLFACGIMASLIAKKDADKKWKTPYIILGTASVLALIGLLLSDNVFAATIILNIVACTLSLVGMAKLSRRFKNKIVNIGCSIISLFFALCTVFWVIVLLRLDIIEIDPLSSAHNIIIKVSYILCGFVFLWTGLRAEDTLSNPSYSYKKPRIIALLVTTVLCAGLVIHSFNDYNSYIEYEASLPNYIGIHSALDNGYVTYGMTYSEIENICGPASYISRSNGTVEYAYYGNVQLCFRGGRFNRWNDSY